MEQFGRAADGSEVGPGDCGRGDGIGHAALEDKVHVHQTVAEDGVAERERQEDQRQHGESCIAVVGSAAVQVRDDVEERERRDGQGVPRVTHFICCRSIGTVARW